MLVWLYTNLYHKNKVCYINTFQDIDPVTLMWFFFLSCKLKVLSDCFNERERSTDVKKMVALLFDPLHCHPGHWQIILYLGGIIDPPLSSWWSYFKTRCICTKFFHTIKGCFINTFCYITTVTQVTCLTASSNFNSISVTLLVWLYTTLYK